MDSEPERKGSDSKDTGEARDRRSAHLGFVAHEVRNPLSTALWTAELLARMTPEDRGGARGEKLSAMCLRSLGRVRQLVEDHFVIERLDAGGLPLRPEPVLLAEALDVAVKRGGAGEVEVHGAPSGAVAADRTLLERAIEAVVHAAGKGGIRPRVEVREHASRVSLTVSGAPPAPNALQDPAKGAESDPKASALGLAAARRIAAALGGSLAIADGAFVLDLPLVAGYRPPAP